MKNHKSIGDSGKQEGFRLGASLITAIETGWRTNAAVPSSTANRAALYITEGVVIGVSALFLYRVMKEKDIAAGVALGGGFKICLQIAFDFNP